MTTVATQVLDRLDAILLANVPGGTKVFRDREDAESRGESPCINVLATDDNVEPFSSEMDRHELLVDVKLNVRGAIPTPLAEAQHLAVHAPIVNDATLKDLCVSARNLGGRYERAEADATSLIKTVQYRFIYLIPKDTL
jgi:hypothetical protein